MDTATLQAITLGCSKNKVDTEHLLAQLGDRYAILPEEWNGKADVVILNTCGFIGDAKEESIGAILQAVQRKMAGDVGKILVFGCLSQRYMAALREEIPEVDGWFGARDLLPVVKALGSFFPVPAYSGKTSLCLSEDFRGLRQALLLLCHTVHPRGPQVGSCGGTCA